MRIILGGTNERTDGRTHAHMGLTGATLDAFAITGGGLEMLGKHIRSLPMGDVLVKKSMGTISVHTGVTCHVI